MFSSKRDPSGPHIRLNRVTALICLSIIGCSKDSRSGEVAGKRAPVPVIVGVVHRRPVPLEIRGIGNVEARRTVSIVSQVSGIIEKVHFTEGESVDEGDVLFTMDARPFRAALASARAQLVRDEALAKQAELDAARATALAEAGAGAAQEAQRAAANAAALKGSVAAGRSAVQSAAVTLAYTTIVAPMSGRTGSLLVNAGNVVQANGDAPLVVIRQLHPIFVRFALPEQDLPAVRSRFAQGNLAVEALPRGSLESERGKLTLIENAVNTATGTIELKAEFDNEDESLWPGQYVDVTLRLGVEDGALVAPEAAILPAQEGSSVFVVRDGKAHLQKVRVDRIVGDLVVVRDGLAAGDRVVVDGQVRLSEGTAVSTKEGNLASTDSAASVTEETSEPVIGGG